MDDLDWEVIITKDEECNAYVRSSGGKIVICSGLLDRFETDAEITAVIAHEVGHVVQRYAAEWLSTPSFSVSQRYSLSRRYINSLFHLN
jgi:predicted Zn-dependent protease